MEAHTASLALDTLRHESALRPERTCCFSGRFLNDLRGLTQPTKRRALFFSEVLKGHLPVQVLDGELVVGSHFSTALSRCLKKDEARRRDREEQVFLDQWQMLNRLGVTALWRRLRDEAEPVE